MTWDEIERLTLPQLISELGGGRKEVNEADSRKEGAARVFDKIRETRGLSMAELKACDIDAVRGWALADTGKPIDPAMFRDLFLQYTNG